MTTQPTARSAPRRGAGRARRAGVLVGLLVLYAGVTAALVWGGRGALDAVLAPGPASLDDLLALGAAALAWALLTWVALCVALGVLASTPRALGTGLDRMATAITPRLLRRVAAALVGASVVAGPVTAATAAAAGGPRQLPPAAGAVFDRPATGALGTGAVVFDRPTGSERVAPAAATPLASTSGTPDATGAASTSPDSTAADPGPADPGPADPGPADSRPADSAAPASAAAGAWVPDRPVAPPATHSGLGVPLVTSAPHAEHAVDETVVVRRGDTLWDIAARHLGPDASVAEIAVEWPRWHAANRDVIGNDPSLIRPGQLLRPPAD